jgi:hypothetical protein
VLDFISKFVENYGKCATLGIRELEVMGKIRSKYTVGTPKDRFQGDIIVLSLQSRPALTDSQSYFIESMLSHNCIQCNVLSLHYFFLFTDGNTSATCTCTNEIMLMSYTEKLFLSMN